MLRHLRIEKGEKVLLNRLSIDDWLWDLAKFDLVVRVGSILEEEQRDEAFDEQVDEGVEEGDEQSEFGAADIIGDLHGLAVFDSSLIASM